MGKKVIFGKQPSEVTTCLHDLVLWVNQLHLGNTDVHSGTSLLCLESSTYVHTLTSHARQKSWWSFKGFWVTKVYVSTPESLVPLPLEATTRKHSLEKTVSLDDWLFKRKKKKRCNSCCPY